jgi:hypothetical protein
MVKIINSEPTTLGALEAPEFDQEKRTYIGMSNIGHQCDTYLWLNFRWAFDKKIPARVKRLFGRGHNEEPLMIAELAKVGITVHSEQKGFVAGWGHIKGHLDGIAESVLEAPLTPHLAEFKTMNDKNFKLMCKNGCESSKPIYYAQCQIGMKFFGLKRTLFMCVNKNDDSYYIERLKYQPAIADMLVKRAEGIILSPEPPKRMFKSSWYECKYCDARNQCHYGSTYSKSCRTCKNVSIQTEGGWKCEKHSTDLTTEQQHLACEDYEVIKGVE